MGKGRWICDETSVCSRRMDDEAVGSVDLQFAASLVGFEGDMGFLLGMNDLCQFRCVCVCVGGWLFP